VLVRELGWTPSQVVREGLWVLEASYLPRKRRGIIGLGEFRSGVSDLGSSKKHLEGPRTVKQEAGSNEDPGETSTPWRTRLQVSPRSLIFSDALLELPQILLDVPCFSCPSPDWTDNALNSRGEISHEYRM
jgi:hypothetical protein